MSAKNTYRVIDKNKLTINITLNIEMFSLRYASQYDEKNRGDFFDSEDANLCPHILFDRIDPFLWQNIQNSILSRGYINRFL